MALIPPPDDEARTDPQLTGDPAVDEVVASLHPLDDTPVDQHVAAFEVAHRRLQDLLADPDTGSAR